MEEQKKKEEEEAKKQKTPPPPTMKVTEGPPKPVEEVKKVDMSKHPLE